MLYAEAVSISGEVVALILLFLLVALLAAVTLVVGTVVAARRCARTGSTGSRAALAVGVAVELAVLAMATLGGYPLMVGLSGAALAGAAIAYRTATLPVAP